MICILVEGGGKTDAAKIFDVHQQVRNVLMSKPQINYGYYILRVYDFISTLHKTTTLSEFFSIGTVVVDLEELIQFVSVAQDYVPVELVQKQDVECGQCGCTTVDTLLEGEYICQSCGFINDNRLECQKDESGPSRNYYSLKQNLLKAIDKFEGRGVVVLGDDLAIIKAELVRKNVDFAHLKREQIHRVLKEHGMTQYYDCLNTVMYMLTGKAYRNISQYVPQILKFHEELEYAYKFVKNANRINSLNVNFKLYKLLRLCGVDCDISEFCTLKTDQKTDEHEEKWEQICKITGWQQ